jgi:Rieske Fe-S protein
MSDPITRRRFLRHLTVLGGASFGGASLLLPSATQAQAEPSWVSVGPAQQFLPETMTHLVLPDAAQGEEIFVAPTGQGAYRVLSARCTHKGCIVHWNAKKKQFDCPCHGGVFDQTGLNIGGPPPKPLASLPVRVDAQGQLYVQVPAS